MEDKMHNGKLKTVIDWVTFARSMGYANDDEVAEVQSKIHEVDSVLKKISNRINGIK